MLKIQQVRQFVIAAASGSFKAAAAGTFRSQAAVSIAMRELEKTIGGPLLERDHRGKFTPLGESVLPLFKELLTVHDSVLGQSQQLAQGRHGSLCLAVAPFLSEQWLPDVIMRFTGLHPDIRIRTIEERSSHIRGLLADGTVNIGIAGLLADDPKLSIRPVAVDSYGVLCSQHHPLAGRRSTTWASLRGEKVIGSDALEALIEAGLTPYLPAPDLTITSPAPLIACVRQNLGITILPVLTRPESFAGLSFVPLTRPNLSRTVAIVTRNSESLLPAARRLVEMLAVSLQAFAQSRGGVPMAADAKMRVRRGRLTRPA